MIGQGTYASLHRIMEEMNQDFKFLSGDVDWQDLLTWMGKFIGLIGAPKMYHDKTTGEHPMTPHIAVTEHNGSLPMDFVSLKAGGVRDAVSHEVYQPGSDAFTQSYGKAARTTNETDVTLKVEQPIAFTGLKTYRLNDYNIQISEATATIEIAYTAFKIDDNGFPMIPDNERIIEGCKWFIAEKVAFNLWGSGLMLDKVFKEIQTNRDFYVGSAQSAALVMTPNEMETFTKAWVRLNPVKHMYEHAWRFAGVREDLNIGS